MKLISTRIVTKDVPSLAKFYEEILQITRVGTDDFVELRTSGAVLALSSERGVVQFNAGAAVAAANRSMILEFEVADVDAERSRLDTFIDRWELEPTSQPWGNRSMLFRDPDGNLINFYTPSRTAK
jgi:catechol 2,3-dioxygenase-like lactoylglutathione lyase family enzyme